jgi:hypothetical protein
MGPYLFGHILGINHQSDDMDGMHGIEEGINHE